MTGWTHTNDIFPNISRKYRQFTIIGPVGPILKRLVIKMNILDTIGNTPMVELKHVVPEDSARVIVKLEWATPPEA